MKNISALQQRLIDHLPAAIVIYNEQGLISYANAHACEISGYPLEELTSTSAPNLLHPEDLDTAHELFAKLLGEPDKPVTIEQRIISKAGNTLWIEAHLINLLGDDSINGIVSYFRDISSRKAVEVQLQHAAKIEALGKVAGSVAHDFNNMLTIISGNTELIRQIGSSDMIDPFLDEIVLASDRAVEITRGLLSMSQRNVVHRTSLNISELVQGYYSMLRHSVPTRINLELRLKEEICPIYADRSQIEQIFLNLVAFTKDFIPDGGSIEIETTTVMLDEEDLRDHIQLMPGEFARIQIRDNSKGLAELDMTQIFDPFPTGELPSRDPGLSLPIVHDIVKQNRGIIQVRTSAKGNEFTILFPRYFGEERVSPSSTIHSPPTGNATVLVVEDERAVLEFICQSLKRLGYRVLPAQSANHALELFSIHKNEIALLITDIIMPQMSGSALITQIRETNPELPVLVISGYIGEEDLLVTCDFDEFLQKPFGVKRLADSVYYLLKDKPDSPPSMTLN